MNSVTIAGAGTADRASGRWSWPMGLWRRLDRRHWTLTALAGAVVSVVATLNVLQMAGATSPWTTLTWAFVMPAASALLILAGWAVADAAGDLRLRRELRVALALLISAALAAALSLYLYQASGLAALTAEDYRKAGKAVPPLPFKFAAEWFSMVVNFGLFVVVGELYLQRARLTASADAALSEQAATARQVLESRLAAMQAQVEPRFLFDSLVDIEALYERDPGLGAATLDRLITYLRVALPRLREAGSTVQAEVELVDAYVAVVAARHGGQPRLEATVEPKAAGARFFPMLLLPLVQRAVRGASASCVPQRIALAAHRRGDAIVTVLRFESPALCADDAELARVRQRLDGLYHGAAALECRDGDGYSEFTLITPCEDGDCNRR
jgi:hypothetical protein